MDSAAQSVSMSEQQPDTWRTRWLAAKAKQTEARDAAHKDPDNSYAELARWAVNAEVQGLESEMAAEVILMLRKALDLDGGSMLGLLREMLKVSCREIFEEFDALKSTFRTEVRNIVYEEFHKLKGKKS